MSPGWLSSGVTNFTKWVGNILGRNEKLVNTSKNINKVIEKGGEVVDGGFDIILWFQKNWQLAILGAVALLVLLRY